VVKTAFGPTMKGARASRAEDLPGADAAARTGGSGKDEDIVVVVAEEEEELA